MLHVRHAVLSDVESLCALITSLAHLFYASPGGAGAEKFREAITPQALALLIELPEMIYLVGEHDGVICGAVGIRNNRHLLHLFVAPARQGRGVGRQLWLAARNAAIAASHAGEFTVNASLNAVSVYRRFGFEEVGDITMANGLVFQPMKLLPATAEPSIDSSRE